VPVREQRQHDDGDAPAGHVHERHVAHLERHRVGEELLHGQGGGLGHQSLRVVARAEPRGVADPRQPLPAQLHLRLRALAVDDEVHVLVADPVVGDIGRARRRSAARPGGARSADGSLASRRGPGALVPACRRRGSRASATETTR
jgi:hypothetical protein